MSFAQALILDATNVESIACIASQHFYSDQPEIALQFYKRLAQMGYNSAELWNNMGLCSFFSSQYHTALQFFGKALEAATDDNMADVWYVVHDGYVLRLPCISLYRPLTVVGTTSATWRLE